MSSGSAAMESTVTLFGVVAVPSLTNCKTFPRGSDTSLNSAFDQVLQPIRQRFFDSTQVYPELGDIHINASMTMKDHSRPIHDLVVDQNPIITTVFMLKNPPSYTATPVGQPAKAAPTSLDDILSRIAKLEAANTNLEAANKNLEAERKTSKDAFTALKREVKNGESAYEALSKKFSTLKRDSDNAYTALSKKLSESEEENQNLWTQLNALKHDHHELRNEHDSLFEAHAELEKPFRSLHRRVLLDKARDKIYSDLSLRRENYENNSDFLTAVKRALPAKRLSDKALDAILITGSLREQGNIVAHEATQKDISLAVLSNDLTKQEVNMLREIYVYVYDEEANF
ncbi:hypothetical protein H0H92_005364 [Tricholoma furcatifolium]|nr:hypothetical protein H0H92_005364 [Tricholoma furcatifolium]